jgi:hypothetical protein
VIFEKIYDNVSNSVTEKTYYYDEKNADGIFRMDVLV